MSSGCVDEFSCIAVAGRRQLSELVIGSQEYVLKVTCILNREICKYIEELALQYSGSM